MTTKLLICATYDMTAQLFSIPFSAQNEGTATRAFTAEVRNPESPLCLYPQDYQLFAIGEYDQTNAKINTFDIPRLIISGSHITMIQQRQNEPQSEADITNTLQNLS